VCAANPGRPIQALFDATEMTTPPRTFCVHDCLCLDNQVSIVTSAAEGAFTF
jgi:hypothetical protein